MDALLRESETNYVLEEHAFAWVTVDDKSVLIVRGNAGIVVEVHYYGLEDEDPIVTVVV